MDSDSEIRRALSRAYRLLSIRARSAEEIRRVLDRAGFGATSAESAIAELQRQGLLDDRAFAADWTRSRMAFKPRSRRLVERELRDKGVSEEDAARAAHAIDDEATARALASRRARLIHDVDRETFLRRLSRYLLARGFSHETTRRAVAAVLSELGDS